MPWLLNAVLHEWGNDAFAVSTSVSVKIELAVQMRFTIGWTRRPYAALLQFDIDWA